MLGEKRSKTAEWPGLAIPRLLVNRLNNWWIAQAIGDKLRLLNILEHIHAYTFMAILRPSTIIAGEQNPLDHKNTLDIWSNGCDSCDSYA